jgi:hypothetical protein
MNRSLGFEMGVGLAATAGGASFVGALSTPESAAESSFDSFHGRAPVRQGGTLVASGAF